VGDVLTGTGSVPTASAIAVVPLSSGVKPLRIDGWREGELRCRGESMAIRVTCDHCGVAKWVKYTLAQYIYSSGEYAVYEQGVFWIIGGGCRHIVCEDCVDYFVRLDQVTIREKGCRFRRTEEEAKVYFKELVQTMSQ